MAYAPYTQVQAERMQTNAAWDSPSISFKAGTSLSLVDLSGWTIDGAAVGAKGRRIILNSTGGKLVMESTTAFHVALTAEDMAELGVGAVTIEIMRRSPVPVRPIIRMTGNNCHGVA